MGVSEREIAAVFGYVQGTEIPVWVDDICERFRTQGLRGSLTDADRPLPQEITVTRECMAAIIDGAGDLDVSFKGDPEMNSPENPPSEEKPYDKFKRLEDTGKPTHEIANAMGVETQTVYGWRSRYKKEKESHGKIES